MKKLSLLFIFFILLSGLHAQNKDSTKYSRGLKYDDTGYQSTPMKAPLVRSLYGSSLPKSASLKKFAPTPLSQGSYATCVGWATSYCALTIVESRQKGLTDKSKISDNAFSPGFTYKLIKSDTDNSCSWGSSINDALYTLKNTGTIRYKDLNINCPTSLSSDLMNEAGKYKINDYAKLFGLTDGNSFKIQAVKKSLSQQNPVIIGMITPPSFYQATDTWNPTESHLGNYGGHAMCVIGYDDEKFGGAFLLQNSWGTSWGDEGYTWIPYTTFADFTKYAYEIIGDLAGNTPTIAKTNSLKGSVRYQLNSGKNMEASLNGNIFKMNDSYKSGTSFRIYIRNSEPAYVYAFGTDATNQVFPVFPYNDQISPALNYTDNEVAIPDEDHFIRMDNTIGKDYLCVLYSTKPLDFNEIISAVESGSGSFEFKVKNALGDKLIGINQTGFSDGDKISFDAKATGKSVVAMIVEIDHIP